MLAELVKQKMRLEGIGTRETGRRIGVAHVTVARLLNGEDLDLEPLRKFCAWVGVSISSALEEKGVGQDALLAKIAMLVEREPQLRALFEQAIDDLSAGKLQLGAVEEIIGYAAYKLGGPIPGAGTGATEDATRVPASREVASRSIQERD
jgi:transcriptional regulator with XRE-family HTH domain